MKAMKTLVSILLAGALTASVFSGCGKEGEGGTSGDAKEWRND